VGLERAPSAAFDEERLEHVPDVVGRSEHPLDPGAAATGPDDGEVAVADVAAPLGVQDDGNAGCEERVAGDQPPTAANFDDQLGR
jgi:hypothetical protein